MHGQTGVAEDFDRLEQRPAGGDDVLHETDELPLLVGAFDPIRRAVLLCRLAHDEKWKPGCERGRRRERDGAELWAREANRSRLELLHCLRDALAEGGQDVGPGLEAVLV